MLPDTDHHVPGTCRNDEDRDSRGDDDQAAAAPYGRAADCASRTAHTGRLTPGPAAAVPARPTMTTMSSARRHSIWALSSCYGDGWCWVRDHGDRRWGESGGGVVPFPGG